MSGKPYSHLARLGLLLAVLVVSTGALANPLRTDSSLLIDSAHMEFEMTYTYEGSDARNERSAANTDNTGPSKNEVDEAEAAAYAQAAVDARLGNAFAGAKWDGADLVWTSLTATATGLAGPSAANTPFSLNLAGTLLLTPTNTSTHTLRMDNASIANYTISLALPANWVVDSTQGLILTASSGNYVQGYAASSGYIYIVVRELPADVTQPFPVPNLPRTVPAGIPATINGTVTDDDPAFASTGQVWWTFEHNGTPYNFSGDTFTFTFWTLGDYVLTLTGVDRAGNRKEASGILTVDRNDKQAPVVSVDAHRTVEVGTNNSFEGSATDNDEAFPLGASFWWNFTIDGLTYNFTGARFNFTFTKLGVYSLTLWVRDFSDNLGYATLEVSVIPPDLVPPTAAAGEDMFVNFGSQVALSGIATDNDPAFGETGRAWWTFTYMGNAVNISGAAATFRFSMAGTYELTFWAMDFWGNVGSDRRIIVVREQDVTPPSIVMAEADAVLAGQVQEFAVESVSDNDPDFPSGSRFWWSFVYEGRVLNFTGTSFSFTFSVLGSYLITFFATDASQNTASAEMRLLVVSPDTVVPEVYAGGDCDIVKDEQCLLEGTAFDATSPLDAGGLVWWTVEFEGTVANITGNPAHYPFSQVGTYNATLWARDLWGNTASDSRTVTVKERPPASLPGDSPAFLSSAPWLLPALALGFAGLGGAALVVAARRRRQEPEVTLPDAPAAGAAGAVLATLPPSGPSHVVEGLLLLYKDGRLIHHQASSAQSMFESPEVVGSMFTAVTEFIRDSFREEASVSRLSFGQNTVVLEASPHLFGAVIVYGEPDDDLRDTLRDTLRRVESAYTGVVESWNGDQDQFKGIQAVVAPIFAATAGVTRADVKAAPHTRTVKLVSGTEHYKGYVRLRVAVVNSTDAPIRQATVTVVFNQNVLHIARVEPAGLPREGLTVHLGDIAPGERLGAIYYLDPQTCATTNIEGMATYTDEDGGQHEVKMKTRREEIICPVFFTAQHANPATMSRLVETTLKAKDSKVFRVLSLPPLLPYNELFAVAREAVQRHHVVLVRNLATKDPFDGRAWFYGQTKHAKSPVVIRAQVSEEKRMVEFFVAAESQAMLTGLLSEFDRSFREIVAERAPGAKVEPVLDASLKGLLAPRSDEPSEPKLK